MKTASDISAPTRAGKTKRSKAAKARNERRRWLRMWGDSAGNSVPTLSLL